MLQKHLRHRLAADPKWREEQRVLVEALPQHSAEQQRTVTYSLKR